MNDQPKPPDPGLPPGVLKEDCEPPAWERQYRYNEDNPFAALDPGGYFDHFLFYHVPSLGGWVLCTLHIANATRRTARGGGVSDRYYGIAVSFPPEGAQLVRVGKGPHVTKAVRVYPSKDNADRLAQYVGLYRRGLEAAHMTRDRISSRRAQGQMYRGQGKTSWRW